MKVHIVRTISFYPIARETNHYTKLKAGSGI